MTELPDWTEFIADETSHQGLDPLGLGTIGGGIVQRQLLPGITNATRHVRYYSFFCWVFWTFWQKEKKTRRLSSEQKKWRARLENVLRAATLWREPKLPGLVGIRKAISIAGLSPNDKVQIDGDDVVSAFIPAFYSSSFRALGCGRWTPEKGAQLTARGEELAKAFDHVLRRSPGSRQALSAIFTNESFIPVKAVRAIADPIRIRQVESSEPEHRLLLELLVRLKTENYEENSQTRSRSFALLMEIVEQARGKISAADDLHRVFATGRLPNNKNFVVPNELWRDYEIWKRYQERQYVKLSIYSLWFEVVKVLDYRVSKEATTQLLLAQLLKEFAKSKVAARHFGSGFMSSSVGKAQESIRKKLRTEPKEFGNSAIALVEAMRNIQQPPPERIGSAIALLLLVASYWRNSRARIEHSNLHRDGGRDRLSIEIISGDADQLERASLSEYLHWTVENYVLKQATKIAVEKLPDYRFFILRDDGGYRLVRKDEASSSESYLSYDQSRIESAYALMSELQLVDLSEGYVLTQSGRNVLQKLRTHHTQKQPPVQSS